MNLPQSSPSNPPDRFWKFDRGLAVANFLLLLIGGSLWAAIDWYPKHRQLQLSLLADEQVPFEGRGNFKVVLLRRFRDGSSLLSIRYTVTFKNSSKVFLPIAAHTSQLFLGKMSESRPGPMSAIPINAPPRPLAWESADFPIAWKEVIRRSEAVLGQHGDKAIKQLSARGIGGAYERVGTLGSLYAGSSSGYDHQFLVRAAKGAYVGIVETLTIRSASDGDQLHRYMTYAFEQPDRMEQIKDKGFRVLAR